MKLNKTAIPFVISIMVVSSLLLTACIPGFSNSDKEKPSAVEQNSAASSTMEKKSATETTSASSTTDSTTTSASATDSSSSEMITQQLSYTSPAGPEQYMISLVVKDKVITEASAEPQAENPVSSNYQKNFAKALSAEVVGKTVSEVAGIDRIGGASLATGAFTRFLGELKS